VDGAGVARHGADRRRLLYWSLGELNFVTASATFLGVFLTMMLTAALMGLMFLSSGSGHDERVEDRLKGEIDLD
jgi:hypothetical protein